jgi:hypothetical protein
MTTLVPVRTRTYGFATQSAANRVGNGTYVHFGDYEDNSLPDTVYYTNAYFDHARFPFNRISTLIHEYSHDAAPVSLDPWLVYAQLLASTQKPVAVTAAGPTVRRLLRRALLLRLLCKLWRARQARRSRAAAVIQQAWADAWYTPSRAICKRRIHREWQAMIAGN